MIKLKEALPLVVYFRLMIVSIMETNNVLGVLDVVGSGCGGGSALPVVGISPAKIEADSAHMSTTAQNRLSDTCVYNRNEAPRLNRETDASAPPTTAQQAPLGTNIVFIRALPTPLWAICRQQSLKPHLH